MISNLIQDNQNLLKRVASLEIVITEYINWKKDEGKFKEYFGKLVEDRAGGSIRNYEQQKVSSKK